MHFPLQLPSVAIIPCQQCALSHQVWRALLFMFLIFLITSCTSSYSASGILSINHFTVTCANLIMAFHLPPYRQQTKMHWLHIWKQTGMLVFQCDFIFFFFFKCVQTTLNLMFISSTQPSFANLSTRHAINNVLYKITCSLSGMAFINPLQAHFILLNLFHNFLPGKQVILSVTNWNTDSKPSVCTLILWCMDSKWVKFWKQQQEIFSWTTEAVATFWQH